MDANPSRLGQQALAGDTRALFLKVFSGEVMKTFNNDCVMKDKVRVRTISSGKSAQFPAIGKTTAEYHVPGSEIQGKKIEHDEKVITIDDLLIAHTFISRIDEAMNHYEVRSEYSKQIGQALAQTYDRNLFSLAIKACRDTGGSGIGNGVAGQGDAESLAAGTSPSASKLVEELFLAAQKLDEKNVPQDQRYVFVPPSVYWSLITQTSLLDRDFGGENGVYSDGKIWRVAGLQIVKTNNLAVNFTSAANMTDYGTKYQVDASDVAALVMHPQALGTVQLMGLASEMEYDIRRQGTLMVSKMAVGHGVLRPECMIEIRKVAE